MDKDKGHHSHFSRSNATFLKGNQICNGTRMAHIYIVRLIYFRDVCFTQKGFEFPFMSFLNTKLVSSLSSLIFFCKTIYVNATLQDATLQDEKECVYLYKRSRDNAVKKKRSRDNKQRFTPVERVP